MDPNPQAEDGFTRIANEILDALMKINLTSYQTRILFAVWSKPTDGGRRRTAFQSLNYAKSPA